MDAAEFWSVGDYSIVGDLWGQAGRDVAASLPVAGRKIVDLATGTGVTAIELARQGAAQVIGVDVTQPLLDEARLRAQRANVDVTWINADVEDVPLPDQCADFVTSTVGIIFAANPRNAIREATRLLRPGGQLVFTSWSPAGLFGHLRQVMANYYPQAPEPWHETETGIKDVAGADAHVVERTFEMRLPSAEHFVDLLEKYSAPFVMAVQQLQNRWPQARAELIETVGRAGQHDATGLTLLVPYLVTTVQR